MQLSAENIGNIVVAVVPGETLDAGNCKDFKTAAAPLLQPNAKLIFDLSGLRFVDSSGLGALLSCLRQLNGAGGELKLCGTSKPVRALFGLVRMHRVFELCNTVQDGILAFATSDLHAKDA
jgi:anti-sigma B factor antagonist